VHPWSPSTRRHVVGQTMFGIWSNVDVPSTPMSRRRNGLVLLSSKYRLQILQELRITQMSTITCCLTTWSRQHWPHRVTLCILTAGALRIPAVAMARRSNSRVDYCFTQVHPLIYSRGDGALLLRPGRGAEYYDQWISQSVCLSVCLSASISLEPLDRASRNFLCRSPVAVARSSSGSVAACYVLPALWMTSRLAVIGRVTMRGRLTLSLLPIAMLRYRNGVWCLWMPCCVLCWTEDRLTVEQNK